MATVVKNREKLWALLDRVQKVDLETLTHTFARHLEYQVGKYKDNLESVDVFHALALTVRDTLIDRWNETRELHREKRAKRVYYLSMEFLLGRLLDTTLVNLGMRDVAAAVLRELGDDLESLRNEEHDAALGNGGLGRLAACFLESMATLDLAAAGAGIRYEFGMFQQRIENGWQREVPDAWLRRGCPWEIPRHDLVYPVCFFGATKPRLGGPGEARDWVPGETVMAMAHDILVPGFDTRTVVNLRLWSARAATELHLEEFNSGDYVRAAQEKIRSENLSKVLYPSDAVRAGRELRLMQEYFLVSATVQDALATFRAEEGDAFERLPERVFFQLNDTHPVLAIPELMRLLVDVHGMSWHSAWELTRACVAYTNHTVMPEALEHWELDLLGRLLPRHLEIALLINHHFLDGLRAKGCDDLRLRALSAVDEGPPQKLRMANLALVGSKAVNGVAALHTEILKKELFREFHALWPAKIQNKTNGIAHRRWLVAANPELADVISRRIGRAWMVNLARVQELEAFVDDAELQSEWRDVRARNKDQLARIIRAETGIVVDTKSLFDAQVKRIHEYKRQLLNALRALGDFVRIKANPRADYTPRTLLFAGKAAPAYVRAKRIVKLVHAIGALVNDDPDVAGRLKVVFLPDYRVSLAERIFPATDLSEQISTAGTEASGTGNMKFMLNGALTMGTLDGANVEIFEEVGEDNIYIFGARVEEIDEMRARGYDPRARIAQSDELREVIALLGSERLAPHGELHDLLRVLVDEGDRYFLLADYPSYVAAQKRASRDYLDTSQWTKRSILNTARCGKFSSDRTVREYASEIWEASPVKQRAPRVRAL